MNLPNVLYLYRNFNEYWYDNIINGNVFLNTPDNFNDPYECNVAGLDSAILYYFGKMFSPKELDAESYKIGINGKIISLQEYRKQELIKLKRMFRVACFSERIDSMPMWAHYAGTHHGYAIAFNPNLLPPEEKNRFLKVKYNDIPISCDEDFFENHHPQLSRGANIAEILSLKSKDWEYEREWRYVIKSTYNKYCNFSKAIIGIYLGIDFDATTHYNELLKIFECCKERKIKLYQIAQSDNSFFSEKKEIVNISEYLMNKSGK